jgi:hypothetical protein
MKARSRALSVSFASLEVLMKNVLNSRALLATGIALLLLAEGAKGQAWVQHGPRPNTQGQVEGITNREVVGAIHAVAAHPTDANTIYAGAVNSGIWKTTNGTAANPTWVEQLGPNRSLSIGALEFDPTDGSNQTLLAGSGRFSSFSGRPGGDRVGTYRTVDGGATWTLLDGGGTLAGLNIAGVAARGATLVIAANNGTPTAANRGIWRSTDTGATWTRISGAAGSGLPAGTSFDLAGDPSNNGRLFTNSGTNGVYRSNDTGATWTKVSDAAIDALLGVTTGNVEIVVGTSNNVYVAVVNGGSLAGLFRSGDGGGTWTALDRPTTTESGVVVGIHPGNQGGTHLSMAADRSNANILYIGGDRQPALNEFTTGLCPCWPNSIGANDYSGRLFRVDASQPAGTQATHITHSNTGVSSSPHADSRDMAVDANGDLLEVDDGGIYRRTTPLTNAGSWTSVIGNIVATEFHGAAWDSRSKIAFGGAQDTGTSHSNNPGGLTWLSVSTGDGGDVGIDDTGTAGTSVRYSSFQGLQVFRRRTYDSANAFTANVFPALTVVGGGAALVAQFTTPIRVNNVTPTRLIIGGGNSVYESLDQGDTITEIGPGIPVNAGGRKPIAYGATGNAEMLYVGSADQVFVRAAAPPAALTASAAYPGAGSGRLVASIAVDPANAQRAFVIDTGNVYQTTDGGGTWTNITGTLATLTPGELRSVAFSTSSADGSVVVGANNGVFIGRGPTFTAWVAAPAGLPRVPVFDLEYDVVDQVLVAGLLGRGAWTLNMSERNPVDVALVLDLSGSMLDTACATCAPKLDLLKDAVELFARLWTVFAAPNDRIAVNYFRTNVTEYLPGGSALFPVLPDTTAMIADVRSQTTTPANLTAMGAGIQMAVNRLTDATRPRSIIVFTDGMQNVNPMVNATTFVIADQAGRPMSNVAATSPATDLNAALGRKVNTIGVGATPAFVDLLSDIAAETNGVFKLTTAPDDELRRFYVEELVDVLRTFSPQLVGYRYGAMSGAERLEDFISNGTARKVVLKLSWKRGAKFELAVEKDGIDVTAAGRMISGPFYKIFAIDVPATISSGTISPGGVWRMRIHGTAGASYEAAAIVDEDVLKYFLTVDARNLVAGAPLIIKARLSAKGRPLTDARITARVLSPRESLGTILAKWPGPRPPGKSQEAGATSGQHLYQALLADDAFRKLLEPVTREVTLHHTNRGNYTGRLNDTKVAGAYTIVFDIKGKNPELGAYERTEIRSASLRFGRVDPRASDLRLEPADRGTRGYVLRVRPVDTLGNHLGPDAGHRLALHLNGKAIQARDHLDGSYAYLLEASDPARAQAKLTVLGQSLYAGPLSGIPRSR